MAAYLPYAHTPGSEPVRKFPLSQGEENVQPRRGVIVRDVGPSCGRSDETMGFASLNPSYDLYDLAPEIRLETRQNPSTSPFTKGDFRLKERNEDFPQT
jgi:hypothetical protein